MTIIWIMTQVCLERPIYPCRSLCLGVRQGCQGRMEAYGFPWSVLWIGHWTVFGTFIHPWSAYGTCMLLGTWFWYFLINWERAIYHSKSITLNWYILYLFVSFSFSFRKVMFAFVFPQASNARLCQVPAGQRHVHHRPVGQAGQQQGRQQSRWVIFVSFIVLSLSKIAFRRRENTRTTDHPKNYQQSEMRKNWSRKKKNKSRSLKISVLIITITITKQE